MSIIIKAVKLWIIGNALIVHFNDKFESNDEIITRTTKISRRIMIPKITIDESRCIPQQQLKELIFFCCRSHQMELNQQCFSEDLYFGLIG